MLSKDLRQRVLQTANTGRPELDAFAHHIGNNLPNHFTYSDIAQTAALTIIGVKNRESKYLLELPSVAKYFAAGGDPQALGAALITVFEQSDPFMADAYRGISCLYFGPCNEA